MANSNPAGNGDGGYDPEAIKAGILQEFADLKHTVQSFGVQAIKDGTWFNKFLMSCLGSYERKVMEQGGAAYLRGKYPGLPTDAIAGKLCELAEKKRSHCRWALRGHGQCSCAHSRSGLAGRDYGGDGGGVLHRAPAAAFGV